MKLMGWRSSSGSWACILFTAWLVLVGTSCDQATAPAPGSIQVDPELLALERAARWPNPAVATIISLQNVYTAKGQDRRGYEFFSSLHREHPDDPVFLAFTGVFGARSAQQEPLLDRVEWVEEAMARLDEAVALDDTLPRFLRAVTLARLPERFEVAPFAIDELDALLTREGSFLWSDAVSVQNRQALLRQGWQAMALAAQTAQRPELAQRAWARAGTSVARSGEPILGTNYSVDGDEGFRFAPPSIWSPEPGVHVAQGYDFGDIAFIETEVGLVVVDAGTHPGNAQRALDDVRSLGVTGPVHTVLLTHAHWDHIGGLDGLLEPGTQTIAQAKFADELAIVNEAGLDYTWFFGEQTARAQPYGPLYDVVPDRLIDVSTELSIGGVDFTLHPVAGGETEDALLIELPASGLLFVGDAFMPYLGAPFVAEGSADGLLATIDTILELEPSLLVHGHPPLTDAWTIEILPAFRDAMVEIRDHTLRGIIDGRDVAEIVRDAPFPELLREHPDAVIPVFVVRRQFIQRLHRARTGYWQPGGEGLTLATEDEWAVAMDLLAGHDEAQWVAAVTSLVSRGDLPLAWRFARRGLVAHPGSVALEALRLRALDGLRQKYQQFNPFKFIVFSELADTPTATLACTRAQC
ncbi:MAG: MBL fold metallo-hydrolase [Myxococcota bacterium]